MLYHMKYWERPSRYYQKGQSIKRKYRKLEMVLVKIESGLFVGLVFHTNHVAYRKDINETN